MTAEWQRKAQNPQVLLQKAIGRIVSWNSSDRRGLESICLGKSTIDLRAGVPLIFLMDLSCSFHFLPNFKWNIGSRDTSVSSTHKWKPSLFCNTLKSWPSLQGDLSNFKPHSLPFHVLTTAPFIVFSSSILPWQKGIKKQRQPNKTSSMGRKLRTGIK